MDLLISLMTLGATALASWLVRDAARDLTRAAEGAEPTAVQPDDGLVERLRRSRGAS